MPNWVFCNLEVKSKTDEQLGEFKKKVSNDKTPFTFEKIIPRPPEEEDNWYDWNIGNWGTKWDACDVTLTEGEKVVNYSFSTAWSPPLPVFEALIADKDLEFSLYYEEEQGWGGEIKVTEGVITEEKSWDIPSSHRDASKRSDGCPCVHNDEEFFDDCFVSRASELDNITPKVLEFVKGLAPTWSEGFESLIKASEKLGKER